MAPRNSVTKKTTSKAATKTSKDRVAKRPKRGYHTFKNGMLNVTPKAGEEELVRTNQQSPLLSLPAELRNRIWHYAVGDKLIRDERDDTRSRIFMKPGQCDRTNTFALLRTCRQVYAETVLLPFSDNTFSIQVFQLRGFKHFRKYQRLQIHSLQVEITNEWFRANFFKVYVKPLLLKMKLSEDLPGLQQVRICLFADTAEPDMPSLVTCEALILSDIVPGLEAKGYEVTVEKMGVSWNMYERQWRTTGSASQ